MGKPLKPNAFAKRMLVIADAIGVNTAKAMQKAALAADQAVVLANPVDTGRSRAAWTVSTGAPKPKDPGGLDSGNPAANGEAAATQALLQGFNALKGYRLSLGPIFIANNVEYIFDLDGGSSQQAPAGMTRHGIIAAQSVLRTAKLLKV